MNENELVQMCVQCFVGGLFSFIPVWFAAWACKKIYYSALSWMRG